MNLDRVIKYNIVKYVKNKKRENIDLRMRVRTTNILSKRRSIDKSYKDTIRDTYNLDFA